MNMIEALVELVEKKMRRRCQNATERHHWERLRHSIGRAKAGGAPGRPRRAINDEDVARWALNSALLLNGLSFHWMPLNNSTTISKARNEKRRRLPRTLHNMMMFLEPNESTREYISLVEGSRRPR